MAKQSVFTMKLEPELRDAFLAETEAAHRPASQVVRELMREYVRARKDARAYDAFLDQKVEVARAQISAGLTISNDEVEAIFAAKRAAALGGPKPEE